MAHTTRSDCSDVSPVAKLEASRSVGSHLKVVF